MNLRNIFLSAMIFIGTAISSAAEPDTSSVILHEINTSDKVTVIVPELLVQKLARVNTIEKDDSELADDQEAKTRVGYRIQVYDNNMSNARSGAEACKQKIESRFPEYIAYVQFNSPYWRVKVGDFTTRSEAEVFLESIREEFPETSSQLRIVRDRINVFNNE